MILIFCNSLLNLSEDVKPLARFRKLTGIWLAPQNLVDGQMKLSCFNVTVFSIFLFEIEIETERSNCKPNRQLLRRLSMYHPQSTSLQELPRPLGFRQTRSPMNSYSTWKRDGKAWFDTNWDSTRTNLRTCTLSTSLLSLLATENRKENRTCSSARLLPIQTNRGQRNRGQGLYSQRMVN